MSASPPSPAPQVCGAYDSSCSKQTQALNTRLQVQPGRGSRLSSLTLGAGAGQGRWGAEAAPRGKEKALFSGGWGGEGVKWRGSQQKDPCENPPVMFYSPEEGPAEDRRVTFRGRHCTSTPTAPQGSARRKSIKADVNMQTARSLSSRFCTGEAGLCCSVCRDSRALPLPPGRHEASGAAVAALDQEWKPWLLTSSLQSSSWFLLSSYPFCRTSTGTF